MKNHWNDVYFSILGHYSDQIYEAILMATTRSLVTLAESSGCDGEVIRAASAMSNAYSGYSSSPSPRSRSQSPVRAGSALSAGETRPMSVLSMLSDMTWTTEKAKEMTYLQSVYKQCSMCDIILHNIYVICKENN